MKLLAKTSLIYILSTTLVFLIGGMVFYYNLRSIVDEEATEHIYVEKNLIEKYIQLHDSIPPTPAINSDFISIRPISKTKPEFLRDTNIFSLEEQETLPYRALTFSATANNKQYEITVSKALFESDDLVEAILLSFSIIIAVLLAATLLVNRFASKKLWKPFLNSIQLLHAYKIDKHAALQFESTSTTEFKELNRALSAMTEKISSDYQHLKSFTENASHELQTPLAVIMASTELLLQQENQSEKQLTAIQQIHQTARKLSRLNQTLLLLAKIENRQFEEKEMIDLGELIQVKLKTYSELLEHKEISVKTNLKASVTKKIHPVLAEVLVSNLLSNAIRHNHIGGSIDIQLTDDKLSISNTGATDPLNAAKVFDRFYKENTSTESTGLGLALVKQVAETNEMKIDYHFNQGIHFFEIRFNQ